MNNIFKFKKFSAFQHPEVFKIGTDAVLAGCLAEISSAEKILDIGTGTGVIALLCAQRNKEAFVYAIDSEKEAAELAKINFENSPFASRLIIQHEDFNNFTLSCKFDYIICNPPYFKISQQLHQRHAMARHQLKLDYSLLLSKSKKIIAEKGRIGCIFPFEEEGNILKIAEQGQLFPLRKVRISGIKNGKVKRTFLELSTENNTMKMEELYIEETPRCWSEKYIELTKDFYL